MEAPLLELVSDSPGNGRIVAVGWVPRDEEGSCWALHAGLGQSSDADGTVPKAIYVIARFSTFTRGSLEWPHCFPHLGLTQTGKRNCERKSWRTELEQILGDVACGGAWG